MITTAALERQARAGDGVAQFRMGYRLAVARRRPARWREAASWWRLAAAQHHIRAQFYLGTCYDFGQGVRRDKRRATQLYALAARAGHEVAQYNLGLCYRDGVGVPRSCSSKRLAQAMRTRSGTWVTAITADAGYAATSTRRLVGTIALRLRRAARKRHAPARKPARAMS